MYHPDESRTDCFEVHDLDLPQSLQLYRLHMVRDGELTYDPVTHPGEANRTIREITETLLDGLDREAGIVIALDSRNRPIGGHVVSVGTLSASLVHPREVFKFGILANAASLIFAHNHPSGDASPSQDDIDMSRRLVKAGDIIGIDVLDSLITGHGTFLSLKERQLI